MPCSKFTWIQTLAFTWSLPGVLPGVISECSPGETITKYGPQKPNKERNSSNHSLRVWVGVEGGISSRKENKLGGKHYYHRYRLGSSREIGGNTGESIGAETLIAGNLIANICNFEIHSDSIKKISI